MAFTFTSDELAALNRLDLYNGGSTPPYNFANGGHRTNFVPALQDVATITDALARLTTENDALADDVADQVALAQDYAGRLSGTSTTSLPLSTGTKTLTTQADKFFEVGRTLRLASAASPTTHWMDIQVTSYSGTSLEGTVLGFDGSGSRADWGIAVTGQPGFSTGYRFLWSTDTNTTEPPAGSIKINNAAPSSLTALNIRKTGWQGDSLGAVIAAWDDGDSGIRSRIRIVQESNPTNWIDLDVTGTLTDSSTWISFPAAYVGAGNAIPNGAIVSVMSAPRGIKGDVGPTGPGYLATSTTSRLIEIASKAFTTQTGLAYQVGTRARATDQANVANWVEGPVTSYTGGVLTIGVDKIGGSGTIAAWNLSVAGQFGVDGTNGTNGSGYSGTSATSLAVGTGTKAFTTQTNLAYVTGTRARALSAANSSNWMEGPITSYTAGVLTIEVDRIGGSGTFADWRLSLSGRDGTDGDDGLDGFAPGYRFAFLTATTDSDPGDGGLKANNATFASITKLFVDNSDNSGGSVTTWLDRMDDSTSTGDKGEIRIASALDENIYQTFKVTGAIVDKTGYREIPVSPLVAAGTLTNTMALVVSFIPRGDKGVDGLGAGDVIGPASSTDNRPALFDGITGKLLKQASAPLATVALTGDSDDLTQGATNLLLTGAERTKLTGIETAADVTDADNVGTAVAGATAKTTPVDADTLPLTDSEASSVLKKLSWANIKATLKTYFDTLYAAVVHDHTFASLTSKPTTLTGYGITDALAASNNLSDVANVATAFGAIKQAASTTATGVVELTTAGEAHGGTDTTRAIVSSALYAAAVDVASAGTTDIGAAASYMVRITGTTTITSLGTVGAGVRRGGYFAGALTLTHNATSLILPGGASITTAANDRFDALSLGSGNWIVLDYTKASGEAVVGGSGGGDATIVDVASASTVNIGAALSPTVRITGTTTITSFGTVASGTRRDVFFAGALTLTHNGTSLILPGAASITTAAGDALRAVSLGSGNWRVLDYTKASGEAVVGGAPPAKGAASDLRTGTDDAKYMTAKAIRDAMAFVALTDASTIAVNMASGFNFSVTLGGDRTLGAPTNSIAGQAGLILITQDGTGSRTLSYNSAWKFAGGTPTASTAAGTVDAIAYTVTTGGGSPIIRATYIKAFA